MYQDDCRLKGVVNLVLRDKHGKVKQHKTIRNKVTDYGVAHMLQRMVDDSQDRAGGHQMPRMMSHMGIGIGAAARADTHTYNATNFDSLPIGTAADSGRATPTNLTATSRKRAVAASTHDRMLQDERGIRVQVMKDTTASSDYAILASQELEKVSGQNIHQLNDTNTKSKLIIKTTRVTGSESTPVINKLRVGLRLKAIGTGSTTDLSTNVNCKIESITQGTPTSDSTTIVFDGLIDSGLQPAASAGATATPVLVDFEYVDGKTLTTYTNTSPHPTFGNVDPMNYTGPTNGPFNEAGNSSSSNAQFKYNEAGLANLGVIRGQIGAFYEREVDTGTTLVGNVSPSSNVSDFGYARLDGTATAPVARFPFLGDEANKPQGQASTGSGNTIGTFATEFVQFGTAVDGIFFGNLVGSSLVEDKGSAPEGTPASEHDFGNTNGLGDLGGLIVSGTGVRQLASFVATANRIKFAAPGSSYQPNALKGGKKHGNRIVYVATFKENNPRPEADYDKFASSFPTLRNPTARIYPITEAGIFNKHKPDIGIFDVDSQSYSSVSDDGDATKAQGVDTRVGAAFVGNSNSNSNTEFIFGVTRDPKIVTFNEEKEVLTGAAEKVTVAAKGFTQGPITQSMLCRTTFDPVNKATSDTLQITWSVQLEDNS